MAPPITHWQRRTLLGSGSFGKVSLAINLDNGDFFAVKSIQSPGSAAEQYALETELALLQCLHSPRIVSCLGADFSGDHGTCARNLFLEYMDGGSIADLIKHSGGRLDETRVQCYTRAIVEGLAYLHAQEVVHCDIKGQNILVGSCGVKIADFGAAKKLSVNACTCEFKGTPLWMAPEVVRGEEQGCAADVWSLGCTVVEMLQGRPPWGHCLSNSSSIMCNVGAALFKIGYSVEAPPLPATISAGCFDFLSKALQRDPKLRWTAAQLLDHPWLQGAQSIESYSPQPSPRSALDFLTSDSDVEDEDDTTPADCPKPSDMANDSIFLPETLASIDEQCKVLGLCGATNIQENCNMSRFGVDDVCIHGKESDWITVRCADMGLGCRHKPFMRKPIGMRVLRRGEVADLSALAFLDQRRSNR